MVSRKKNRFPRKYLYLPFVAVILYVLAASIFGLWPIRHNDKPSVSLAPTTSKQLSAQSNFTNGGKKSDNKAPAPAATNSTTDTGGSLPRSVPSSTAWSTSKDGSSIVVMSPINNGLFASGDTVYGTATSNTIAYELEDNVSGVILQGQANVVNGKFSVKFNFSTTGTSGRINIFNQAPDGTESNNVSVNVRFE